MEIANGVFYNVKTMLVITVLTSCRCLQPHNNYLQVKKVQGMTIYYLHKTQVTCFTAVTESTVSIDIVIYLSQQQIAIPESTMFAASIRPINNALY